MKSHRPLTPFTPPVRPLQPSQRRAMEEAESLMPSAAQELRQSLHWSEDFAQRSMSKPRKPKC